MSSSMIGETPDKVNHASEQKVKESYNDPSRLARGFVNHLRGKFFTTRPTLYYHGKSYFQWNRRCYEGCGLRPALETRGFSGVVGWEWPRVPLIS
jgi:hypothetical protein